MKSERQHLLELCEAIVLNDEVLIGDYSVIGDVEKYVREKRKHDSARKIVKSGHRLEDLTEDWFEGEPLLIEIIEDSPFKGILPL